MLSLKYGTQIERCMSHMASKQEQQDYLGNRKGPAGEREDEEGLEGANISKIVIYVYENITINPLF